MPHQNDDRFLISLNPTTETELGRVPAMSRDDIDRSVARAQNAFRDWSQRPIGERRQLVKQLAAVILDETQGIAELIATEQGKPVTEAILSEIVAVLAILKNLTRNAHKLLRPHRVRHEQILFSHKKSSYRNEPYGVFAIISAWNFPFSVPVPQIAAALVAGNTVVFKPAPDAVLIGQKIGELFAAAGFPEGVFNILFVKDIDAPHLTAHSGVDKIIFTGSTAVGAKVMTVAATQITPVVLELGGKDPAIVAADADLPRAAKGVVWGAMFNAGQVCASIERVYVERSVAERFTELCLEEIKELTVGDPLDPNTQVGPMSKIEQLEKVEAQLKDALERGARILYGGYRIKRAGYFFAPALLSNVDHSMAIMREETFGPVLPIMAVDSLEQAIELANDSPYGLASYVWTNSRETAERLANALHVGTVMINDGTSSWGEPNAPWGGVKKSGIGRTRARFGLEEMVQVKYISRDHGGNRSNLWWYPYDAGVLKFAHSAVKALYSTIFFDKVGNLLCVVFTNRFYANVHWRAVLLNLKKLF